MTSLLENSTWAGGRVLIL